MERVSVFVRESEQDSNWVQHFALLPRVPHVGEFIRYDEDDHREPPWYRVEQVLHIPRDTDPNVDDEVWSAMVFAVRKEAALRMQPPPIETEMRHSAIAEMRPPFPLFPSLAQWSGYHLAGASILLAVLINGLMVYYGNTYSCFFLFIASVAIVTVLRGWKPGVFGALLATLAILFFFVEPICTFSIARSEDGYRLGGFSLAIFGACLAACFAHRIVVVKK